MWLYSALGLCWGHPALPRDMAVPWALRVLVLAVDVPWVGHPGLLHRLPMCKHTGMHRRLRRSPLISRAVSAACSRAEKSRGRTAVTGPPPCGGHAAGWGPAPAVTAHVLNLVSFHVELV